MGLHSSGMERENKELGLPHHLPTCVARLCVALQLYPRDGCLARRCPASLLPSPWSLAFLGDGLWSHPPCWWSTITTLPGLADTAPCRAPCGHAVLLCGARGGQALCSGW